MNKYAYHRPHKKSLLEQGIAVPALGPSKWAVKSEVEQIKEVQGDLFGTEPIELREQVWPEKQDANRS